eukprot:TRINITY_DN873_c0_g2_i1.p1 TRINITY_DN873_c0_g2~~TRINITY_DN873_c0_g2_i1.p1  ORF type:complete len:942 (+),score=183.08 TRINITY_DN873_c0_g2_i1:131-2956(+)
MPPTDRTLPRSRSNRVLDQPRQRPRLSQSVTTGRLVSESGLDAPVVVAPLRSLPAPQCDAWRPPRQPEEQASNTPLTPVLMHQADQAAQTVPRSSSSETPDDSRTDTGTPSNSGTWVRQTRERMTSFAALPPSPPRSPRTPVSNPAVRRRRSLTQTAAVVQPRESTASALSEGRRAQFAKVLSSENVTAVGLPKQSSVPHLHGLQGSAHRLRGRTSPRQTQKMTLPQQAPPSPPPASVVAAAAAVSPPPRKASAPVRTTMRWKKGKFIGQGAFGKVCIGLCQDTGQLMAVKEIEVQAKDPNIKKRLAALQAEIRVMKQLSHPNIVRYLCTERKGTAVNIFMEFVPGGSISSLLKEFGPLGESTTASYTEQILLAVGHLHANGVVHRDIKGANVLVSVNGGIKVTDFGTAMYLNEIKKAEASISTGTPFWMAPEVITDSGFGWQCDIWSTACTVVEMLTAKQPFAHVSDNPLVCMTYIGSGHRPISFPNELLGSLTGECQDFLGQCLKRNALERPGAQELLQHPLFEVHWLEEEEEEDLDNNRQRTSGSTRVASLGSAASRDTGSNSNGSPTGSMPVRCFTETPTVATHSPFEAGTEPPDSMLRDASDEDEPDCDTEPQPSNVRGHNRSASGAGSRTTAAAISLPGMLAPAGEVTASMISASTISALPQEQQPCPPAGSAGLSPSGQAIGLAVQLSGGGVSDGPQLSPFQPASGGSQALGLGGTPPRISLKGKKESVSVRPLARPTMPGHLLNQRRRRSLGTDAGSRGDDQTAVPGTGADSWLQIQLHLQQSCLNLLGEDTADGQESPAPTSPATTAYQAGPGTGKACYSRDEIFVLLAQHLEAGNAEDRIARIEDQPVSPEQSVSQLPAGLKQPKYAVSATGPWAPDERDSGGGDEVGDESGEASAVRNRSCKDKTRQVLVVGLVVGLVLAIAILVAVIVT